MYVKPFVDTGLNTLETMALAVSFLTLYLGIIFYQGWLKTDDHKTLLSMVIILSNTIFILLAFKIMFGEYFKDRIIALKKNKLIKDLKKRVKITPLQATETKEEKLKDQELGKVQGSSKYSNAERIWKNGD